MTSVVNVVTAADSFRLTTIARLKAEIMPTIPVDISVDDALLHMAIDSASAACATYIGRPIACQDYTETFRPAYWTDTLLLSRFPVISIDGITQDSVDVATTDYTHDPDAGSLRKMLSDRLTWWYGATIVVSYRAGWVLPEQTNGGSGSASTRTLPHDIEYAAIAAAKARYFARDRDPMLNSVSLPGVGSEDYRTNVALNGGLPDLSMALLAPYRVPAL